MVWDIVFGRRRGRGSGFTIGAWACVYGGGIQTAYRDNSQRMDTTWRPALGIGLGHRTQSVIEWMLDVSIGLGSAVDESNATVLRSLDLLFEPRFIAHWYESWPSSAYAGSVSFMVNSMH